MNCRHCGEPLQHTFVDLGFAPPSNSYLTEQELSVPELYFPLKLKVCDACWLVQTEDYAQADLFFSKDYAYFSSTSTSWLVHAAAYSAEMIKRFELTERSFVIEVASNDGYLLRNFVAAKIPCLGVEPTDSTADAAEKVGVPVLREFFGEALAKRLTAEGKQADLIAGNNVFAHVPDINDFTRGLKAALKPDGTITLEFPHLMRLIESVQFDTVYHEHFSYLSLQTVKRIFELAGLRVCDVDQLPTHGGSLRVYGCHVDDLRPDSSAVNDILAEEKEFGLQKLETYAVFQKKVDQLKNEFLAFLIEQNKAGKRVAGYGAAAKGNTLLNYAGVKVDLMPYVCDAAASKQGKYLPGSHVPVFSPEKLRQKRPDLVIIFPWNIAKEVVETHHYISEWGGRFVVAVPGLTLL